MKLRLFFFTAVLCAGAYLLSLFVSLQSIGEGVSSGTAVQPEGPYSLVVFLALFFSVTLFFLLLIRLHRGELLYRVMFSLALFFGLVNVVSIVFPLSFSLLVAGIFLLGFFLVQTVWTHDLIVLLAAGGIAPLFGVQFSVDSAMLLLVILSVYDCIAVFVTKHMLTLAHHMIRSQASFAFFIPERFCDFSLPLTAVRPGTGFLILGGGDIVLPTLLLIAVGREHIQYAFAGVVGLILGLFVNHLLLVVYRRPLPALPLLTIGAIAGISISRIFL